jgi:hypothetical protein
MITNFKEFLMLYSARPSPSPPPLLGFYTGAQDSLNTALLIQNY